MCGQADRRPDVINDSSTRFNSVELLLDIAELVERLGFQMVLKAGIGRFSPELRLIFRPAVTKG